MYAFRYSRPHDVADAVARLRADSEAKLLAGGMTLIPSMKYRLAAPSALLDIGRLAQLQGIAEVDGRLAIGAGVRHVEVADSRVVQERIPELAVLAGAIGDPQVRNRGTLGGALANNDPAADYPAAALALAAQVVTDRRTLAADEFFVDLFTTALEPDEIVVRVSFAVPKRAGYAKFRHPASGYAMAGVFVAELDDGIRVAVTGAGPVRLSPWRGRAGVGTRILDRGRGRHRLSGRRPQRRLPCSGGLSCATGQGDDGRSRRPCARRDDRTQRRTRRLVARRNPLNPVTPTTTGSAGGSDPDPIPDLPPSPTVANR